MPVYSYACDKCGKIFKKIVPPKTETMPCECGGTGLKQVSLPIDPTVKVALNQGHKRKSVIRGINQIMKARSRNYQKKYEVHDMIAEHGFKNVAKNTSLINPETKKIKTKWDEK